MAKHSVKFELVKHHYERGLWIEARLDKAVECGWITEAERKQIVGGGE